VTGVETTQAGWSRLGPASGHTQMTGRTVAAAAAPGTVVTGGRPGTEHIVGTSLSDRLAAMAHLIDIGTARGGLNGFSAELLRDADELLSRAGERLQLSAQHTIVVLAGGTGSGKSSLFNLLAGADFSPVGAVRPVTRDPHACVWGMQGAGPLLDWLGVKPRFRYARSSALGEGERSLGGLLLLDLPDHDSVLAGRSTEVSRLVGLADLMIWVLDPQKYADAAVHSRYLVPMSGHSSVMAVVLNQADLLARGQVEDCEADLRRLLDAEGLHDARVLVTSAATGAGVDDLRKMLVETVTARRSALQRISADVDATAIRFAPYAHPPSDPSDEGGADDTAGPVLSKASAEALAEAFSRAAGVQGVGRTLQSARELKAVDHVGWPVAWLIDRLLGRDPVRKIRLGALWDELRGVSAASAGAQQSEIDNAITVLADEAGRGLPVPWPATVLDAARSRITELPGSLGAAIAEALPVENAVSPWWRLVAVWQGLLLGGAVVGLGWILALTAVGVFHISDSAPVPLRDVSMLPWVVLMVAAILGLGWLTAGGCMSIAVRLALQEREQVEQDMHEGVAAVAREMVIGPVEHELSEYARFREELAVASALA
jgi:GTP-binding protein EngB required for normal cell division